METTNTYDAWIGRDAYDVNGDKIGSIDAIYYDNQTGRPEWLAIRTGFFGMNTSFAPISGANVDGDNLRLPCTKDQVKDAPNVDPYSGSLETDDEQALFSHYGFAYDAGRYGDDARFDRDYTVDADRLRDTDRSDVAETTRSEEQLRVGTETIATGKARLRKYVVTEQQTITVPVTREEVRVEREPITDAEAGEIGDDEAEVTTYAERPVVTTEKVAKEKVRLVKDSVTDDETVSGEVRKEQVDVDVDNDVRSRR
jgi:uncharacterized protein (TIGR02271 family)